MSQPADVLLSKMCGGSALLSECLIIDGLPGMINVLREIGFKGCFAGLHARALMVGSLTAMQFFVYENVKNVIVNSCDSVSLERQHRLVKSSEKRS